MRRTLAARPQRVECAVLKDIIEAGRAARAQDADCARVSGAIRLAEQDIAVLASRQLHADEMCKQWTAIRDRTIFMIRDVRRNIISRAHEAKEAEKWMVEKFALSRSRELSKLLSRIYRSAEEVDTRVAALFCAHLSTLPVKVDSACPSERQKLTVAASVSLSRSSAGCSRNPQSADPG